MELVCGNPVSENKHDHAVARGEPPVHTRFKTGQSGNPRGRPRDARNFSTVLNDALNQTVLVTENGRRRNISKRELGIRQLVDKFAMTEMQATRMLLGLMLERERLMAAAPPAERPSFGIADEKVIDNLLKRLRGDE
jgi:hypothetical protein